MTSQYLPLFLDICVGLILIGFLLYGMEKGLIMTLAGIVVLIVSMIGASVVADALTPPITEWIAPHVAEAMEAQALESFPALAQVDGQELLVQMEAALADSSLVEAVLDFTGFELSQLEALVNSATISASELRSEMFSAVAVTVCTGFVNLIVWILALMVISLVLHIVIQTMNLAAKLPVIKQFNALGGALIGLVEGVLLVYILVLVAQVLGWMPSDAVLAETQLVSFFIGSNPVSSFVSMADLPVVLE